MIAKALILFGHGARDVRWADPFLRLRNKVAASIPGTEVSLAFLEFMAPSLPDAVEALAEEGCGSVMVVPVFFGEGGHVRNDLPPLIENLRREYPSMSIACTSAIGEDDAVLDALAAYCLRVASV